MATKKKLYRKRLLLSKKTKKRGLKDGEMEKCKDSLEWKEEEIGGDNLLYHFRFEMRKMKESKVKVIEVSAQSFLEGSVVGEVMVDGELMGRVEGTVANSRLQISLHDGRKRFSIQGLSFFF